MNYTQFQYGFWHPFGPHGPEEADEILERKQAEIKRNGCTLWSFQRRSDACLAAWKRILAEANSVHVFCSEGKGAKKPQGAALDCRCYRELGGTDWKTIWEGVRVPHPFHGHQTEATAFIVEEIRTPEGACDQPAVEWLRLDDMRNEQWNSTPLWTRPEYLIRPGGEAKMRSYRAILVLKKPYLAVVSTDDHKTANRREQT